MNTPWTPEQSITLHMIARLLGEQFPELMPVSVVHIGDGWDNSAFAVNGAFVFRFPRRAVAVDGLVREGLVLAALSEILPLPIPVPRYIGQPSARFPFPFMGYPRIPGRTACTARFSDEQRALLVRPLANFLKQLHEIPLSLAESLDITGDVFGRLDMGKRLPVLLERLTAAEVKGLLYDTDELARFAERIALERDKPFLRLVHGDLYARHVLVDAEGEVTGIIDWGDVHIGDPAIDLSLAFGFLPHASLSDFFAVYGEIDSLTEARALFKALFMAVVLSLYAHDIGDTLLLDEAQGSAERLREYMRERGISS